MPGDFKLSATLKAHEEDVRAIVFPRRDTLFSASRDNTIRTWSLTSKAPPTYDDTIALQAGHWLNALAYLPPTAQHPQGLLAAGGRETFIFVKEPGRPVEEDPRRLLIGHAGNVTCLAFSEDGSRLISGGWDSQVFLWDVEKGSVIVELEGHGAPVWGVTVYDEKFVLTACADKKIRVFDFNGKCHKVIEGHTDVVRCFCKLPAGHSSGADFASAGNDEVIRLWTIDGQSRGELEGHTAYIYSLAALPNGDIVSSSEDRTVRVWRDGLCIQTITHPAISLWSVTTCLETGDIASGASDNIIRVFSRDPERQASPEAIEAFDSTNRMYAIPAETAAQGQPFQKENLPGPEALQTQVGSRDGQQLFVKEHDGSVTAHLWSSSTSQWNLIGTVVSGEGSGTNKKTYNGKEYDYVFDIDIEDGKPPLKLPYNSTDSPWDAARIFLERNELPMTYYEQVAHWISDQTKGAKLGQESTSAPPPQHASDPWGTDRRYRPGDGGNSATSTRTLPLRTCMTINEGNAPKGVQLLAENSTQLKSTSKISSGAALTEEDVSALQGMADQLTKTPQDPNPTPAQITALLKISSSWPSKSRVPAIALLARLAVSPNFFNLTNSNGKSIIDTIVAAGLLKQRQETANNAVHAMRLLVNLTAANADQFTDGTFSSILESTKPFAAEPESPAQFRAVGTLYLNLAILLTSKASAFQNDRADRETRAEKLLIAIATMLESDSPHAADSDAVYRALAALGTLLTLSNDFKTKYKAEVGGTLHMVTKSGMASREEVKEIVQEIRDLTR